jgi:hypothetical protein
VSPSLGFEQFGTGATVSGEFDNAVAKLLELDAIEARLEFVKRNGQLLGSAMRMTIS